MENRLYGFVIDEEIRFDIIKRRLVPFTDEPSMNSITIRVTSFNMTLVHLLTLLLTSNDSNIVSKDIILNDVWEKHKLPSYRQRLWHAINELRRKLSVIALPDDFILSIRDVSYSINSLHKGDSLFLE